MRQKGYRIIDCIDDYIGVALPSIASDTLDALVDIMSQFGLTISEKKLVSPSTQVVCLGVLIDSIKGTIQIPLTSFSKFWTQYVSGVAELITA